MLGILLTFQRHMLCPSSGLTWIGWVFVYRILIQQNMARKVGPCLHLAPVMTRGQRKVSWPWSPQKKSLWQVVFQSSHHAQALCRTCLHMLLPICELVLSSVTVDKGMIMDQKWVFCYSSVSWLSKWSFNCSCVPCLGLAVFLRRLVVGCVIWKCGKVEAHRWWL
jgi:hypothetical protein